MPTVVVEAARERGLTEKIRFDQRLKSAAWSSADATWTLDTETQSGEHQQMSCNVLFVCSGYYNYSHGYTPTLTGIEEFAGTVIHPQHWPQDLDYAGKRVVIIGSGATAMTLVPAMAKTAASVTMLQRSPSRARPRTRC